MGKLSPSIRKNLLSIGSLTGCFTLIAVGCGIIGGLGVGLVVGGVLGAIAHTVANS